MSCFRSFSRPIPVMLLVGFMAGCGNNSGPETLSTPKVGSSYHYENYMTDSTGARVAGSEFVSTVRVDATGLTYKGKSGVHRMVSNFGDTTYLRYEPNGDVLIYGTLESFGGGLPQDLPIGYEPGWITFPFGSRTPTTLPAVDTVVTLPFQGTDVTAVVRGAGTVTAIGSEDLTVGGEHLPTQKAVLNLNLTATAFLLVSINLNITDTIWYSPKIGLIARDIGSLRAAPALLPGLNRGSGRALTSYSLQ